MKITQLTIALLTTAVMFTSCNDDDDISEGRFDRAELFATSNTNGSITVYNFADPNSVNTTTLTTGSIDNEGIIYDDATDQLIFASRTNGTVNIAGGIEDLITGTTNALNFTAGPANLTSARSVAINGNFIVVANNLSNQLFVYERSGTTVTLRNTVEVDFALWQIQFRGNDLFAVVDLTSDLAVFNNFLTTNTTGGVVRPSKRITIEGINRTHGFVFNAEDDVAIMTDIAEAAATTPGFDTDGAFQIIGGFTSKFNNVPDGGTLALSEQIRVEGAATLLGNPVATTYDAETNTVFIAERANMGGRVLGFNIDTANGNTAPIINNLLPGASTVFFYGED